MHYDFGCFDLKQKNLQPLDNPFSTSLSPMRPERTFSSGKWRAIIHAPETR